MKCSSASVKGVSLPTCCFVWKVQKVLVALGCNFWMKKIWDKIEMHHAPRDGLKVGFGTKSGPTHSYIEPREFSNTKVVPKSRLICCGPTQL